MLVRLVTAVGMVAAALALALTALVLGMRAHSPIARNALRRFNRRFGNPRQMKTAGTPGAYAGIVRHVGRRSGRRYETPVVPCAVTGGFVIALPYGASADWVQNVLAAGLATVVTEGQTYEVERPEVVPITDVITAFPAGARRNLRLFHVDEALRVARAQQCAVTPATG